MYYLGLLAGLLISSAPMAETPADSSIVIGKTFKDCTNCPEMVVLPAGEFMMGSRIDLLNRRNELPLHKVTIPRPFAVGKYEVTFEEWDLCVAEGGCSYKPDHIGGPSAGWGRGKRPVFRVSWNNAQSYTKWLGIKTGHSYRLLTEAEWEYMARAGTTTLYNTGDTITENRANFVGKERSRRRRQEIHKEIKNLPVDMFPPNAFGVHGIHGGVWELTQDCWHENYIGAPTDGSAWINDGDCSRRVERGGSWNNTAAAIRSSGRGWRSLNGQSVSKGLRIARDLP